MVSALLAQKTARFEMLLAGRSARVERGAPRLRTPLLALGIAALLFTSPGCPRGPNAKPLNTLELATSPEPQAEADYREAGELEARGETEKAEARYRAFLDVWPKDPLAPYARLALGRLALDAGNPKAAVAHFQEVAKAKDKTLAERARMYEGVAQSQLGEHELAVAALRPYVGRTVDPRETSLLLDALATSEAAIGDQLAALDTSDRELRGELSPAQRRLVEARVKSLLDTIEPTLSLERAYEILRRDGPLWPEVAERLLRKSHLRGDSARVAAIADDMHNQHIELSDELATLVLRAQRPTAEDPSVVGAILPLSGRGREAGEAALQGLLLSADQPAPTGHAPLKLVYRDDAGDPERALSAFEDLVTVHRAIAVIGPLGSNVARAVAARAKILHVPLIVLTPDGSLTRSADVVFRLMADPSEEASALVRRALKAGAKRFAVLHPEGPFGDSMRGAFEAAVRAEGASLAGDVSYAASTTSFLREAEATVALAPDAIILADAASRVSLIAPALASKGLWSVARGGKAPEGRAALYLVPAAGFDPSLAQSSRRYLQGALFAAPFDPARAPAFATGYREHFQAEPNLFSATAHDAFSLLRAALYGGANTRTRLSEALLTVRVPDSVTGSTGFAATRGPARPVQIETLLGEAFVAVD
jgi:ABC-type branched-subunit amino acid transport system substrate-binding protein/predicted negative regulator of RcsB-dependent stress response